MGNNLLGLVSDIQRFSLHDGPGIRTSVFVKGCNMNCAWCHNPELISRQPEYIVDPSKCIHCGLCEDDCYSGARRLVGQWMSPSNVLKQVLMDRDYYAQEGGMTISGGEPTLQPNFTEQLLLLAHDEGIHCAMESNLYTSVQTLRRLLPNLDYLMCDLKIWDSNMHLKWTEVNNTVILENMRYVSQCNIPMLVRIPVVCGINDDDKNIQNTAEFLSRLPTLQCLELLPYHRLGLSKHLASGVEQQPFETPSKEKLSHLVDIAKAYHIHVRTAGVNAQ